jgi:hypothetical protein
MSLLQSFADGPAPPDHNAPRLDLAAALKPEALKVWLDYQFAAHAERRDALVMAGERFTLATPAGIEDDGVAQRATDFGVQLRAAQSATDDTHKLVKAPVLTAQRMIDGARKSIVDDLDAVLKAVQVKMTAYLQRKADEARAKAAAEAAAKEAEAQRAMAEAQAHATKANVEAAVEAFTEAREAIAIASAPPAQLARVTSALGSGAGLRSNWTYRIVDLTKVPAAYLTLNETVVKAAIKTAPKAPDGRPLIDIPGLEIVNDAKASFR